MVRPPVTVTKGALEGRRLKTITDKHSPNLTESDLGPTVSGIFRFNFGSRAHWVRTSARKTTNR